MREVGAGKVKATAAVAAPTRDRYVDFLRGLSICVVVMAHWFVAMNRFRFEFRQGTVVVHDIVLITGLWPLTWVLNIMPLFFFVGGFSNHLTYETMRAKGLGFGAFMRVRLLRLARPTGIYLAIWIPAQLLLLVTGRGGPDLIRWSLMLFGPLWFLIVFVLITSMTPFTLRLHRRFGPLLLPFLVIAIAGVDVIRLNAGDRVSGWANVLLVWGLAHQMGYFYADGTLTRLPRWFHAAIAIGGLVALAGLTSFGVYPRSLLGTTDTKVSNMNPPTVTIVALTAWMVGAAMFMRASATAWLAKPKVWGRVIAVNSVIMTIYLWHLTAYLGALMVLNPFDLGDPADGDVQGWLLRPTAAAVWLFVIVKLLGRFERGPREPRRGASMQTG